MNPLRSVVPMRRSDIEAVSWTQRTLSLTPQDSILQSAMLSDAVSVIGYTAQACVLPTSA